MIEPHHVDGDFQLYLGETREVLAQLPEGSVDCIVTSPPYMGLRDYKLDPTVWGGDSACEHRWGDELVEHLRGTQANEGFNERWGRAVGDRKQELVQDTKLAHGRFCIECGAWFGQLGLEPTVQLYVAHVVEVFRQVHRVLAAHGTAWLNLVDSYARAQAGVKEKDLMLVPARVAIALVDDGWYLRSDVVWHKPNALPSSVRDRPSLAHEHVFMLTKQSAYYFDQEAVREPHKEDGRKVTSVKQGDGSIQHRDGERWPNGGRNIRSVWTIPSQPFSAKWLGIEDDDHYAVFPEALVEPCLLASCPREVCAKCGTPRYRIVERVATGWDGSTYGERAVEATGGAIDGGTEASTLGSSNGKLTADHRTVGWTECPCELGLPTDSFEPILTPLGDGDEDDPSMEVGRAGLARGRNDGEGVRTMTRYEQREYAAQMKAWSPDQIAAVREDYALSDEAWAHYVRTDRAGARPLPGEVLDELVAGGLLERVELPVVPPGTYRSGVVLDPFMGSGTTAVVARRLGRVVWGVEQSPASARIAAVRAGQWWKKPRPSGQRAPEDQLSLLG